MFDLDIINDGEPMKKPGRPSSKCLLPDTPRKVGIVSSTVPLYSSKQMVVVQPPPRPVRVIKTNDLERLIDDWDEDVDNEY